MSARPAPSLDRELAAWLGATVGPALHLDAPFGAITTYRVGGRTAGMVRVGEPQQFSAIVSAVRGAGLPIVVLGQGSNLLVAERGWPGLVLALGSAFEDVLLDDEGVVAGGACALPTLARRLAAAGRTGLEWAVGVPGSVGGAVRMNAGGHGSDVAASLLEAQILDLATGSCRWRPAAELALGFRSSAVGATDVVLRARFALGRGDPAVGRRALDEIVRWRREHQPGARNAGSVFVNPANVPAGRLVEGAGLRGFRLASARVSERHANFIVADPGGSADDVAALIALARERVAEVWGVLLEPEIRLVGFVPEDLETPLASVPNALQEVESFGRSDGRRA